MTAAKVIDASATVAMAFQEPEGAAVLQEIVGGSLLAPELLPYEIASAARKKIVKTPGAKEVILDLLTKSLDLGAGLHPVDQVAVTRIAVEEKLSSYDASYLWLSRTLAMPLVTLDRRLMSI